MSWWLEYHLNFILGFPALVRLHIYIETVPWGTFDKKNLKKKMLSYKYRISHHKDKVVVILSHRYDFNPALVRCDIYWNCSFGTVSIERYKSYQCGNFSHEDVMVVRPYHPYLKDGLYIEMEEFYLCWNDTWICEGTSSHIAGKFSILAATFFT